MAVWELEPRQANSESEFSGTYLLAYSLANTTHTMSTTLAVKPPPYALWTDLAWERAHGSRGQVFVS